MLHLTLYELARYEPDTIPSERFNRLVRVEAAEVLEMRDPNEGQGGGPETKSRHQYVRAGGMIWRRRLPAESVGDEWRLQPGDEDPARWELLDGDGHVRNPLTGLDRGGSRTRSVIDVYAEEAHDHPLVIVERQVMVTLDGDDREVCIRGEYVSAEKNQIELLAGPCVGAWWDVPLPPCPDCGGEIVWAEAGYVPGTRRCVACGSRFSVQTTAAL